MNLIEILKANGISDETIQAVQEDMKTNSIFTASEENLDIRYGKLKTDHEGVKNQLGEANKLIDTLKKSTKGQEEAQQKISAYEQQVAQLQQELEQTKIDSAIKVELLSSKAVDVDYLAFQLNKKLNADGEKLTLDDNGNIKGWSDKLAGLKIQFPKMFESDTTNDGYQVFDPNKLHKGEPDGKPTVTKEEFNKMGYSKLVSLRKENPELYSQMTKG